MIKRLLLMGAFCIGLMALWGTNASAYPPRLGGWGWSGGSPITFTSLWLGAANTEQKPTEYEVTLYPNVLTVYFRNPGDNLGGVSVNFTNPNLSVTGGNILIPTGLKGKGKITDALTFGDCPGEGNPAGECQVGENGKLWLLWESASGCEENDMVLQINCIKDYLADTYAPNIQWRPYAIDIFNFDAVVEAFTDLISGGDLEEVVHGDFYGCELNEATKEYVCGTVTIWGYKNSDPTGYCGPPAPLRGHEGDPVCSVP